MIINLEDVKKEKSIEDVIEEYQAIENKSSELSFLLKMIIASYKDSEIAYTLPITEEYKKKDITDENVTKLIAEITTVFNEHLDYLKSDGFKTFNLEQVKDFYNTNGGTFIITRCCCDDSVPDEVIKQMHSEYYSKLYLSCLFS